MTEATGCLGGIAMHSELPVSVRKLGAGLRIQKQ